MNEREAFETWLVDFKSNAITKRSPNGEYVSAITENYFSVWQAALASQAQQTESKILSFDDNGQLVDKSQAQQTENLITRKAFICPACEGVDADSPVSSCHCMENDSNTFIEGTITYRLPPAPEGDKE